MEKTSRSAAGTILFTAPLGKERSGAPTVPRERRGRHRPLRAPPELPRRGRDGVGRRRDAPAQLPPPPRLPADHLRLEGGHVGRGSGALPPRRAAPGRGLRGGLAG